MFVQLVSSSERSVQQRAVYEVCSAVVSGVVSSLPPNLSESVGGQTLLDAVWILDAETSAPPKDALRSAVSSFSKTLLCFSLSILFLSFFFFFFFFFLFVLICLLSLSLLHLSFLFCFVLCLSFLFIFCLKLFFLSQFLSLVKDIHRRRLISQELLEQQLEVFVVLKTSSFSLETHVSKGENVGRIWNHCERENVL